MAPKWKGSDTRDLDIPERSCKLLPLSEKVNILNKRRKKNQMLRLLRSTVSTNLLWNYEEKNIYIWASFAVEPQTAKVTTIVFEEWLAEMENGLYL